MKSTDTVGFGPVSSPEAVAARRQGLRDALAAGQIPEPCHGCGIARLVTSPRPLRAVHKLKGALSLLRGGRTLPTGRRLRLPVLD